MERARRELDLEVVRGGNERVSRVAGSGLDARRRDLGVVSRYLERDARGKWSRERGERQRGSVDRSNLQHQIETFDRNDGVNDFEQRTAARSGEVRPPNARIRCFVSES